MGPGNPPPAPKIPQRATADAPVDTEKLAMQRRNLLLKRAGLRSLRIDRNPGLSQDANDGGISIKNTP